MEKQIYYHDTDAGGVVYYGRYLQYLEEARTEYLSDHGLTVLQLRDKGFLYAVRECHITYKKPARYGDVITCTAELKKITAAQMFFHQNIHLKEEGSLLATADVALVSLTKDFKPAPIPEDIKELLSTPPLTTVNQPPGLVYG